MGESVATPPQQSAETLLMSNILDRMTDMDRRSERHFKDIHELLDDVRERVTRLEERDNRAAIEGLKVDHARDVLVLSERIDKLEADRDRMSGVGLAVSVAKNYGPWIFGTATMGYLFVAELLPQIPG